MNTCRVKWEGDQILKREIAVGDTCVCEGSSSL